MVEFSEPGESNIITDIMDIKKAGTMQRPKITLLTMSIVFMDLDSFISWNKWMRAQDTRLHAELKMPLLLQC